MNIGIDIDGVLFPWADVANEVLMERFGIDDPGPHVTWTHLKDTVESTAWRWLWSEEGQGDVFSQMERIYPGAAEMVNALTRNPENRVHFVTHRDPRYTCMWTALYLRRHFRAHSWAGLHVVQNAVAKRTLGRWDVFVDDKPKTVFDFLAHTGAQVFSPVRPWNADELGGMDVPNLVLYDDPSEVVAWVEPRA